MAMDGAPMSRSQRPMRRGIAITMLVVIVGVVIGVATWITIRSANAPAAPVASGTPTPVASRPVRHRAIVLAPVYTASATIKQGVFSFHLRRVGHDRLVGTLDYFSPAGPTGYSPTRDISSTDAISGTISGRHITLDATRTPFYFDGLLSATQLTGTFTITNQGTIRGTYTFCPTTDTRREATC